MNAIDLKFEKLRAEKSKAFVAFITAGDPSLELTKELALTLESAGVDLIEIGIPFSDPLADGLTIQASSQRALSRGVTVNEIFKTVASIRKKSKIPIAMMTYYNPVFHFPQNTFVARAQGAGADGLIIPDLPPEEGEDLIEECIRRKMAMPFFLAPTSTPQRMKKIIQASTGFIYYVSLTGVTGIRKDIASGILESIAQAKRMTLKPVCVGFGISTPEHIHSVCRVADGVIVGSAIIQEIQKYSSSRFLLEKIYDFVKKLTSATSADVHRKVYHV